VDPAQAQRALADGAADMVEMTRAQITDPDLVARLRASKPDRIRPCLLCNQQCMVRDNRNPILTCVIEPGSGHELDDGDLPADDEHPSTVLVVGGGPAGMEAARVLAERGHRVRLAERGPALGGMLVTAAAVHGRHRLGVAVDWWRRELARLGVTVLLEHEVGPAELEDAAAQGMRVLLATGSVPGPRHYRIAPGAHVVEAADLVALASSGGLDQLPEGRAVVFDPIGGPVGVGIAELLAANGRPTSIVTQDQIAGTQLALTGDLAEANSRLQRAGVRRELRSLLREAAADHVLLEDRWTGEQRTADCGFVVHCGHRLPDEALYLNRPGTLRAGDCVAPRTVLEAVLEARRAAMAISAADQLPELPALTVTGGGR
jgi:2,4-dienoyl-CoA reductase (NADPH2)